MSTPHLAGPVAGLALPILRADGSPSWDIEVSLQEPGGADFHSGLALPADTPLQHIATGLLSGVRGVAAAHSPMLTALVGDQLDAGRPVPPPSAPGRLTVSIVDQVIEHQRIAHGETRMPVMEIDGYDGAVSAHLVRAVLAQAGLW